jgi:hypothetical protein
MIGTENLPLNSEDAPKSGDQKQNPQKALEEVEKDDPFHFAPAGCMSVVVGGHIIE